MRSTDEQQSIEETVARDPEIMGGVLVFRGTRIPIATVLASLDAGVTMQVIFEDYPTLTEEKITHARAYVSAHAPSGSNGPSWSPGLAYQHLKHAMASESIVSHTTVRGSMRKEPRPDHSPSVDEYQSAGTNDFFQILREKESRAATKEAQRRSLSEQEVQRIDEANSVAMQELFKRYGGHRRYSPAPDDES